MMALSLNDTSVLEALDLSAGKITVLKALLNPEISLVGHVLETCVYLKLKLLDNQIRLSKEFPDLEKYRELLEILAPETLEDHIGIAVKLLIELLERQIEAEGGKLFMKGSFLLYGRTVSKVIALISVLPLQLPHHLTGIVASTGVLGKCELLMGVSEVLLEELKDPLKTRDEYTLAEVYMAIMPVLMRFVGEEYNGIPEAREVLETLTKAVLKGKPEESKCQKRFAKEELEESLVLVFDAAFVLQGEIVCNLVRALGSGGRQELREDIWTDILDYLGDCEEALNELPEPVAKRWSLQRMEDFKSIFRKTRELIGL